MCVCVLRVFVVLSPLRRERERERDGGEEETERVEREQALLPFVFSVFVLGLRQRQWIFKGRIRNYEIQRERKKGGVGPRSKRCKG